jgi:hypothetical protein
MTELEQKVWNAIRECILSEDIYCCHVFGIANHCDLTIPQIKGCIGSLIKKNLVSEVERNEFDTIPSTQIIKEETQ